MVFFPCVRFENQVMMSFRGQAHQMRNWDIRQKMKYCMQLQNELTEMYLLVNKLFLICIERGLRMIMENPYSQEHYLRRYWCFPATLIDKDRRLRGDYYRKPTQYWFVNCEPQHNFIFEAMPNNASSSIEWVTSGVMRREHGIECSQKVARSLIHPDYANRFIREFILEETDGETNEESVR